jgi:hypothetical protein
LVRFGFGAQALVMVGAVFVASTTALSIRGAAADDDAAAYMPTTGIIVGAVLLLLLLDLLPAAAWWTIKKGKPSARRWAIAASILNLLMGASGIRVWMKMPHMHTWIIYIFYGITGILGLIAFWRNENPAPATVRKQIRIAGDGTSKIKDYAGQGASITIVWFSAGWWSTFATHHGLVFPGILPFLAQMEIAVLLTTLAHELGHLVAGWASGKVLRSLQVGPFRWAIRNGAWRFEFNLLKFYGGAVGMVTPDLVNVRSRKAFSLIGGPVASLVTGSIFIVATMLTPGKPWQGYWLFFSMMATFSISAFVVNLIPIKPASLYSDGAQLYQIVTNGPWARVHFAFAMVTTSLVSRIRPRDFDINVLNQAADSVPAGDRGLLLRLFACLHYLDRNEIPQAIGSMQEAEALYDQCVFEKPQDVCAEFAFINAFYKRDLPAAERWSQRIEALKKIEPDADYWRARTALLWLRGEQNEARDTWERGNALAQKLPLAGTYDFTRSCFAKLRAELDAPVLTVPPPLQTAFELPGVPVAVEA